MKKIKIGLFGFGVVGGGIYKVLEKKPKLGAAIKKVVIKHPEKDRDAPKELFTTDANEILQNPEIDLVVELIDDADAALNIVTRAMNSGKSVVSANKKMIAENLSFLIETARKNKVSFLYEAAVCGSVPIIRNLEEYFDNQLITNVTGIINGSTNYILTQMTKHNLDYADVLKKAQELGFAESDPSLDVEGLDARNKLKIIALHAFGKLINDKNIQVTGIEEISSFDIKYAKEKGLIIKLIATCSIDESETLNEISVLPSFVPKLHPLRLTDNEFNGVLIGGQLADEQFLYGKGAGRYPTSSAVLSDISAYKYNYKYEYKKEIEIDSKFNKLSAKFYISFPQGVNFNFNSIGDVEEAHQSKEKCYVVLNGDVKTVHKACKENGFSVIRFL